MEKSSLGKLINALGSDNTYSYATTTSTFIKLTLLNDERDEIWINTRDISAFRQVKAEGTEISNIKMINGSEFNVQETASLIAKSM
jgi:competence transcription factor ComK